MAYRYIALIRKEPGTDYWIDCPDLSGCAASGKSIEEAKERFADAVHFHLVGVKDQDLSYELPVPRTRKDVLEDAEGSYVAVYELVVDEPYMTQ